MSSMLQLKLHKTAIKLDQNIAEARLFKSNLPKRHLQFYIDKFSFIRRLQGSGSFAMEATVLSKLKNCPIKIAQMRWCTSQAACSTVDATQPSKKPPKEHT